MQNDESSSGGEEKDDYEKVVPLLTIPFGFGTIQFARPGQSPTPKERKKQTSKPIRGSCFGEENSLLDKKRKLNEIGMNQLN